ncbi:MAG: hypothetical protein AB7O45_10470 [Alphaproteobacteria bacterium]
MAPGLPSAALRSLFAALVLAIAPPATATTVAIKNCSGETQRIELRPGTGAPSDGAALWVVDICHTRDWSGSCGIGPTCWVKVRAGQANEVNTLSAAEICLFQAQTGRPVTTALSDRGCQ